MTRPEPDSTDDATLTGKKTFSKIIGNPDEAEQTRTLKLIVLGCEPNPPYGPNEKTCQLLLDLIGAAVNHYEKNGDGALNDVLWKIAVTIYDVQLGEFPESAEEWDSYDGVIIPGSFSSAYDSDPWIQNLQRVLQESIVREKRPTMGICFGHQVFAQSFSDGFVTRAPSGPRAGRYTTRLTPEGERLYQGCGSSGTIDLYFSHGDMVSALPPSAVCIGGSSTVPIEMAAYFGSSEEAEAFRVSSVLAASTNAGRETHLNGAKVRPFALTFQSHPEYASSDGGGVRTMDAVMDAMDARSSFDPTHSAAVRHDAHQAFPLVQQNSVEALCKACEILGWFHPRDTSSGSF
jgi:GMP synthase-like glutamine amidotransferase